MPLTLPFGDQDQGFVQVSLTTPPSTTPVAQSTLPAGQTIQLTSADPATFTVTLDSPAVPDPDGTVTVASFTIVSAAAPAQPNAPIGISLLILNADGSTAASASDTVTVSETATESVGILFGTPVVIPASAGGRRK